ncbi:MAG: sigma-70 family RNA polymerase sigma factor [Bacteroidota bacterium]
MNETEVIKGCLKNNRESQKALYDYFYNKMLGVCLRYAKDQTEAKQMLHEGFTTVFSTLKSFKSVEPLEGWIRNIMIHACIDNLKKNKQNLIVSTVYANKTTVDTTEEISDEVLFSKVDNEKILKGVQELTPAYRKVFNLHLIEGYPHKKIAELLDISEETSELTLAKAKYNLRRNIKQLIKIKNGK